MARKPPATEAPPSADTSAGLILVATSTATEGIVLSILSQLPPALGCPVLVVHYSDSRPSKDFAGNLQRVTPLQVLEAKNGMALAANTIVVCPGDTELVLQQDGTVALLPYQPGPTLRMDRVLNAVAQLQGERGVAVLLAGSGTEGAAGALAIKRANGIVLAQTPPAGAAIGMPRAAIQVGAADFVRPSEELGGLLASLASGRLDRASPDEEEVVSQIIQLLQSRRGTKLDQYRVATLRRRLRKRALGQGYSSLREYHAFLSESQEEMDQLFDSLLINVTEFFRDSEAFRVVQERIVPELAARAREGREVRIWSSGTATGEEAFSLAILMAEALNSPADWANVKVFATDVDPGALAEARSGFFEASRLASVGAERIERFFTRVGPGFEVKKGIRRMVVFGQHDLTKDPPIGRLDLLVCRNVLIYFDVPMQQRLINTFRYSLIDGGFLFLGRSEAISQEAEGFDSVERRFRIFRKAPGSGYATIARASEGKPNPTSEANQIRVAMQDSARDAEIIADLGSAVVDMAHMVICAIGPRFELRLWNRFARNLLGAPQGNGDAFETLPTLGDSALRPAVESVIATGRRARLDSVEFHHNGRRLFLDLLVDAIQTPEGQRAALIIGQDVSAREELREALKARSVMLQETIEELQTTNEELQSANEELETTNEELQSANEELMTLNEEMQSTNEELETTNEELQSTNEELATVNARLESSSTRVEQLSKVLRNVADLCGNAMIVLDMQENVTLWSANAREYFGQREDEVLGRSIFGTTLGLPAESLRQTLREAISAGKTRQLPDITTTAVDGRPRRLNIMVHTLHDENSRPAGWVLACVDTTPQLRAEDAARTAAARYDAMLSAATDGIVIVDKEGKIIETNHAANTLLADEKVTHLWDIAAERAVMFQLKGALADMTTKHHDPAAQASHDFPVRTKTGRTLGITLHSVSAPGAPPLVLVRELPSAS